MYVDNWGNSSVSKLSVRLDGIIIGIILYCLELIDLSSVKKVSVVCVFSCSNTWVKKNDPY